MNAACHCWCLNIYIMYLMSFNFVLSFIVCKVHFDCNTAREFLVRKQSLSIFYHKLLCTSNFIFTTKWLWPFGLSFWKFQTFISHSLSKLFSLLTFFFEHLTGAIIFYHKIKIQNLMHYKSMYLNMLCFVNAEIEI